MKNISLILSVFAMVMAPMHSCKQDCFQKGQELNVVKMRNDYSNNAYAFLSYSDKQDTLVNVNCLFSESPDWPLSLRDGYFLYGWMDKEIVVLSMEKDEFKEKYSNNQIDTQIDSLKQYVIDWHPLEEWWYRIEPCDGRRYTDAQNGSVDTSLVNNTIKEGRLEKYFQRMETE